MEPQFAETKVHPWRRRNGSWYADFSKFYIAMEQGANVRRKTNAISK